MVTVVPTVLATTPDEYATMMARAASLSQRVHVDIADGSFTDSTTIGLPQVQIEDQVVLDLHLMLQNPGEQLETALSLKPNLIILHAEASGDLPALFAHMRELGVKAGIGILPQTPVESARKLIELADHVLVFTGNLGHNNGQFRLDQLNRARDIRAIKSDIEVSVDGGVNDQNASLITLHGVDVLYTGGFLQGAEDPQAAYDDLLQQIGVTA